MPWLGLKMTEVFGAYANQPPSAAPPPRNHDLLKNRPPKKKHQNENAFMRGNAASREPIWSGLRQLANAAPIGIPTRKILVTQCIVNHGWERLASTADMSLGKRRVDSG